MMWDSKIDELKSMKMIMRAEKGKEQVTKQRRNGKLTAYERLEVLFDKNSFVEVNGMVSMKNEENNFSMKNVCDDNPITGYGQINGKTVFAVSQDSTIKGGTLGKKQTEKICYVLDKAIEIKVPFIFINDGGGAKIQDGISGLAGYAEVFVRNTKASGVIPQISVIMGPCAGGASYSSELCDFVFMTEKTSQLFVSGPQVVKECIGEVISVEMLGGAHVHECKSGQVHFVYPDDSSCLIGVRNLLGYLPQNYKEKSILVQGISMDECDNIPNIVPANSKKPYDVKDVIYTFVDRGSFLEIQKEYAKNIVIGFSRLEGKTVAIVANQPCYLGGALDINASDKAARFVRFCDCFNIPILTLVDVPAFMLGSEQEHAGIIRHGAKLLYAFAEATVPKVSLIMRKAYGGAFAAMNCKSIGADIVYAWPIAEIAVMGAMFAIDIINRKDIQAAEDKEFKRQQLCEKYNQKFMNPYSAATNGYVDEIIFPKDTKSRILSALEMLENKSLNMHEKKHGNIPM